jgi:large subunit ribosomal protein L35
VAKKLKKKTHKGLAKRVKVTATGKLLHRRSGKAHLLSKKSGRHRRRLSAPGEITGGQARIARRLLVLE